MTTTVQPAPARIEPFAYTFAQRDDELRLRDLHRSHFRHRMAVRNGGTGREALVKFPAAFDCNNGRTAWSDVIAADSLLTVEPRPRPVAFEYEPLPQGAVRDQMRGHFLLPAYFYADPQFDDLTYQYVAADVFPFMADGFECYYLDIFVPTDRVTLRIAGDGFDVRLKDGPQADQESCLAFELDGFKTGPELPRDLANRAVDGRDGTLKLVANPHGRTEVYWELTNPRLNTRYKIYFLANPAERAAATAAALTAAVVAHDKELDRLFGAYHHGRLDAFAGKFLLAAGGRILDHDEDAFALRKRAAAVARAHGVPIAEVVEFLVPSPD